MRIDGNGRGWAIKEITWTRISNGLLDDPKHVERMGHALWLYLQILRRVTKEVEGVGTVLGGKPVTDSEIAAFGLTIRSISRYRKTLVDHGYITAKLAPHGYIYTVCNSKKFNMNGSNGHRGVPGGVEAE
jgi:hypothetical protein